MKEYYAVYYAGGPIYAVGTTKNAAVDNYIEENKQELRGDILRDEIKSLAECKRNILDATAGEIAEGKMCVSECTKALYDAIWNEDYDPESYGEIEIPYSSCYRTILCTEEEQEKAEKDEN